MSKGITEYKKKKITSMVLHLISIALSALSVWLSIGWAESAFDNTWIKVFMIAAIFAVIVKRFITIGMMIEAYENGNIGMVILTLGANLAVTSVLFMTSYFYAINTSSDEINQKIVNSDQVTMLKSQIASAQDRVDSLSVYSSADLASSAKHENQQLLQDAANRRASIQTQIANLERPAMPSYMSQFMSDDCSPKHDSSGLAYKSKAADLCPQWRKIAASYLDKRKALENQLASLGNVQTSDYNANYQSYVGALSHLEMLQNKLATMTADGTGVESAYSKEVMVYSWVLGVAPSEADSFRWLVYSFIIDLFAITASILAHANMSAYRRRREEMKAIAEMGLSGKRGKMKIGGFNGNQGYAGNGWGYTMPVMQPVQGMQPVIMNGGGGVSGVTSKPSQAQQPFKKPAGFVHSELTEYAGDKVQCIVDNLQNMERVSRDSVRSVLAQNKLGLTNQGYSQLMSELEKGGHVVKNGNMYFKLPPQTQVR